MERQKAAELDNMFTLEVLSGIKRLEKVTVEGPPSWFAECLVLHLTGRGGPPASTLSWPTECRMRSVHAPGERKWQRAATRQFWQPTLDWREYALRNGTEFPNDIDRYFPPSQ